MYKLYILLNSTPISQDSTQTLPSTTVYTEVFKIKAAAVKANGSSEPKGVLSTLGSTSPVLHKSKCRGWFNAVNNNFQGTLGAQSADLPTLDLGCLRS